MAALIIIIFGRCNNSKDFCYLFKKKMDILINILHFFYISLLRLIISFAIINYIWKLSTYNLSKKVKNLKVNICICFLEIHIGLIYSICFVVFFQIWNYHTCHFIIPHFLSKNKGTYIILYGTDQQASTILVKYELKCMYKSRRPSFVIT